MKKTLAVLLALVLVGAAFAQDPAPAAPAPTMVKNVGPEITYGLTGSFGFNALRADTITSLDSAGALKGKNVPVIGFSYQDGQFFKVEPWAKFTLGDFWFKGTMGYKGSKYNGAGVLEVANVQDQIVKLAAGVSKDGLSFTNTFVLDDNNYGDSTSSIPPAAYNDMEFTVTKDNLEGGLLMRTNMTGAPHMTGYGDFYYALDNLGMQDWYLKVGKIFGMMDVSIGGTDTNWSYNFRNYGLYPSTSVIYYTTTARTGTGLFWSGDNKDTVPVYSELDLSKWAPITVKAGYIIPASKLASNTTLLIDWLEGSNMAFAASYKLDKVGTFQLGLIPNVATERLTTGVATTLGDKAVLVTDYYVDAHKDNAPTTLFGDFDFSMVPNLTARFAFDAKFGKYVSMKTGATTGTGTAASPYTATYVSTMLMNFGLEGKYDLKDVVAGLVANAGIYGGFASAGTNETATGVAWAAPAAATNYVAANYTEANVRGKALGMKPFMVALRGTYTFANKDSTYLESLLTVNTAALKLSGQGTKVENGYYTTEKVTANYTAMAGVGKVGFSLGYTAYLGVPKAADLGITTAAAIENYKIWLAQNYNPWSLAVTYTATF